MNPAAPVTKDTAIVKSPCDDFPLSVCHGRVGRASVIDTADTAVAHHQTLRCRGDYSGSGHERLIAALGFLAALDESNRIELFVPARDHAQHFHAILLRLALFE